MAQNAIASQHPGIATARNTDRKQGIDIGTTENNMKKGSIGLIIETHELSVNLATIAKFTDLLLSTTNTLDRS
jgi:hypothetical protein